MQASIFHRSRLPDGWVRPITPRILVESLRAIRSTKSTNSARLCDLLGVEERRTSEICTQLVAMGLLCSVSHELVMITDEGTRFFDAAIKDDKEKLHSHLLQYGPYRAMSNQLEKKSLSLEDITGSCGLNQVAAETILRLLEWVGKLQRSESSVFYVTVRQQISVDSFANILDTIWNDLTRTKLGVKREFLRIPEVRDQVCKRLHLSFDVFDRLLEETVSKWPTKFELSSAPAQVAGARSEGGIHLRNRHYFYIRRLREEVKS